MECVNSWRKNTSESCIKVRHRTLAESLTHQQALVQHSSFVLNAFQAGSYFNNIIVV
ncbi:hypothetical protein I79_022139 [Cricetulus griseus]|uniref:Uncharacterized protein n=1 Tax=Cricetulus griseus TaxID=10029 RepID=G3IEJ2_CRIGR|nr:hypothetical protein I79_022139 [Cricetulus griseus]